MFQVEVNAISSFLEYKHLNFNEDKCHPMSISRKRSSSLYLLMQVNNYRYLGVIITNILSWQPHIMAMCKKSKEINWNDVQKPACMNTTAQIHFEVIPDYHQTTFVSSIESFTQGRNWQY